MFTYVCRIYIHTVPQAGFATAAAAAPDRQTQMQGNQPSININHGKGHTLLSEYVRAVCSVISKI